MYDIVARLLKGADYEYDSVVMRDAADEIERLRAGLVMCMQEAADHHRENEARAKIGGSDMAKRKAKAIVARSGVLMHNIKVIARAALEQGVKPNNTEEK